LCKEVEETIGLAFEIGIEGSMGEANARGV
jgi:hypothetical protein